MLGQYLDIATPALAVLSLPLPCLINEDEAYSQAIVFLEEKAVRPTGILEKLRPAHARQSGSVTTAYPWRCFSAALIECEASPTPGPPR